MKKIAFQGQGLLPLISDVRILKFCLPAGRQGTRLSVSLIQALYLVMTQSLDGGALEWG
jgi:hypothetical protein